MKRSNGHKCSKTVQKIIFYEEFMRCQLDLPKLIQLLVNKWQNRSQSKKVVDMEQLADFLTNCGNILRFSLKIHEYIDVSLH